MPGLSGVTRTPKSNHWLLGSYPSSIKATWYTAVLQPVRVLIANWIIGVNKLPHHRHDGTNSNTKLRHHSLKERMGRWDGRSGTFLYLGIRRVSKIKMFNPVDARIKIRLQNPLANICIKDPLTTSPMKRQRSVAPQLVTLKVLSSNGNFLVLLCIAVSCN